jgi:transposase-like protein
VTKGKPHKPEHIIGLPRRAEAELGKGLSVAQVCRKPAVSEQTFYRWRSQYGGTRADQMKRLKELEAENARLKKVVAEHALDIKMLKEVARGNF